uniref:Putative secreted protein n=1 Tax=Anopheles darlingi TaxID=43151 RepID=A0A2M4D8B5_ANODA
MMIRGSNMLAAFLSAGSCSWSRVKHSSTMFKAKWQETNKPNPPYLPRPHHLRSVSLTLQLEPPFQCRQPLE